MEKTSIIQKTVVDDVLSKIEIVRSAGNLHLPSDYSVQNAIQAAGLIIAEVTDKNGKTALEVCTRESVANSLLYMATNGLNPIKSQCYFMIYDGKLKCQRSYQGSIALAKRFGGVKEVSAQTIYQGDSKDFEYHVDIETGRKKLLKHKPKIENIDTKKIVGAYAIVTLNDGSTDFEIMSMAQIREAWLMRQGKGLTKAHENFGDRMAEKTVINRICGKYINSSNDEVLLLGSQEDESSDDVKAENSLILAEAPNSKQLPKSETEIEKNNKLSEEKAEKSKQTIKPSF